MKNFEFSNNNQEGISEVEKTDYEKALWAKAEQLCNARVELEERKNQLYQKINGKHGTDLMDLEKEYWQADKDLNNIKEQENAIQKALEDLDANSISKDELEKLLPKEEENNEKKLSKKKQRILEEREKLGVDPRENPYALKEFNNEKMRLTTGRQAKSIKNTDTYNALNEFFHKTADTHGGKGAIKKGDTYISSSGKKIRKK